MAKAKELRKRIKTVTNTRKITRTMEMVAASKLKRALDRVTAAQPYLDKLVDILAALTRDADASLVAKYPLLEKREPKRTLVFLLTANRGLCGSYNSGLIRLARRLVTEERDAGREVEFHIAGKKGLQYFRFRNWDIARSYTDMPDRPSFADADRFSDVFTEAFLSGRVDRVMLVFAHFQSALSQPPTVLNLLPIAPADVAGDGDADTDGAATGLRHDFMFKPSADAILGKLFPLYVRNMVYRVLVEAVASEHSARRVAMKSATDNAQDMITTLTRSFNRARQAQITQEIAEIVGGAAALE